MEVPMKKSLLVLTPFFLFVPVLASAEAVAPEASSALHQEHRDLTPRERIERTAVKGLKPRHEEYLRLSTRYDENIADAGMAERVLTALREDPALAERVMRIKVSSKDRIVRLEGVVNDAAEKTLVEERVAALEGVDKVDSALRVKRSDKDLLED
jgi:osmotically-inducible protein OsmY